LEIENQFLDFSYGNEHGKNLEIKGTPNRFFDFGDTRDTSI